MKETPAANSVAGEYEATTARKEAKGEHGSGEKGRVVKRGARVRAWAQRE